MTTYRLLIKTTDDKFVHGASPIGGDYTICGLDTFGDVMLGIESSEPTQKPIDCPKCIEMIRHCKQISSKHIKKHKT